MKIEIHSQTEDGASSQLSPDSKSLPELVNTLSYLASLDGNYTLQGVPSSWAPLLTYLCFAIGSTTVELQGDEIVGPAWQAADYGRNMTEVVLEAMCAIRPETSIVLRLLDSETPIPQSRRGYEFAEPEHDFVPNPVMAERRAKVIGIEAARELYAPTRPHVLVVPNNPEIIELTQNLLTQLGIREKWYLLILDGAAGIVPEDLSNLLPDQHYSVWDDTYKQMWNIRDYFSRTFHTAVVSYVKGAQVTAVEYGVSYSTFRGSLFHARTDRDLTHPESILKLRHALLNNTAKE